MKKTLSYIPKLVVNGQEVAQYAKTVTCTIKETEVQLNCTYVNESELVNAYKSSFEVTASDKKITVVYVKAENRVSATVYINGNIAFSSLSMQAVFTVINSAYNISKSALNNLYVKSNSTRKQSSKAINKVTVNSSFEF
jgi:hypothetical protein